MDTKIHETSIRVKDGGRITIPHDVREALGLEIGDLAEIELTEHGERFNRSINSEGRVTVPVRLRRKHDIEDDGEVDIAVVATLSEPRERRVSGSGVAE